MPQEDNLDLELNVGENLLVYGRFFGLPRDEIRHRSAELLDFVQLTDRRDSRVDSLSGGMKRRLTIARALINTPELMLLDEPTTGLDPQARHALWDRLYRLKQQGVTLVLTTHYMDEAEQLCDRLVIMDQAKIVAEGSPRELIDRIVEREVVELRFGARNGMPTLDDLGDHVEVMQDRIVIGASDGDAVVDEVHRARPATRDGARQAKHPRGRLPAPHGPEPRRLMAALRRTFAVVRWHAQSYRKLWFGTVTVSFVNPIFFLVSIGLLLGALVDRSEPEPRRAQLPAVRRTRAARDDGDADGIERDDVPGDRRHQMAEDVPRRRRDPGSRSGTRRRRPDVGRGADRRRRVAVRRDRRDRRRRSRHRSRCSPRSPRCSAGSLSAPC